MPAHKSFQLAPKSFLISRIDYDPSSLIAKSASPVLLGMTFLICTLSVWKFYSDSSNVISQGNQWWQWWTSQNVGYFLSYNHGQKSLGQLSSINILHPFRNFLAVLPLPTRYKVETPKKILETRFQLCLWGEGRSWACVNWKTPQKCKTFLDFCP